MIPEKKDYYTKTGAETQICRQDVTWNSGYRQKSTLSVKKKEAYGNFEVKAISQAAGQDTA
jgi:hypothetical protein